MVHVRRLESGTPTFGHSGWLWKSAFLLYDHATESLWHNQTGVALSGPLRGQSLDRLPSTFCTFDEWRKAHPETKVLDRPAGPDHDRDLYAERNGRLGFGLAVEIGEGQRLYPLEDIAKDGLLHDAIAGVPVVVVLHSNGTAASAFDRRLGDATLTFELQREDDGSLSLRSAGGRWIVPGGEPIPGSATESRLETLLTSLWERGAWRRQHPGGSVWGE